MTLAWMSGWDTLTCARGRDKGLRWGMFFIDRLLSSELTGELLAWVGVCRIPVKTMMERERERERDREREREREREVVVFFFFVCLVFFCGGGGGGGGAGAGLDGGKGRETEMEKENV